MSADNLQFRLRNTKIYLIYDEKDITENDLVVTDYLYSGLDELKNQYTYWRVTQYHVRRAEYDALYMQQKMEKEAIRTYHVVDKAATHEEA